jgi:hypothetical protein
MSFLETIAKQEVKRWLSPYALRGDSIEYTASGQPGIGSHRLCAQVGAYAWFNGESVKLTSRQVAVTKVGGVPCLYIFSLVELYEEILHPERTADQLTLF